MRRVGKNQLESGNKLPLVENFYTIQGEGYNTGKAAYFIRLGGCDIGCKWCDSKGTWNTDLSSLKLVTEIVDNILQTIADCVVITGGEPTLYNLAKLTELLKKHNLKTFLETSGAYELSGEWDWVCVSPKPNKPPKESVLKKASELKVIIYNFYEDIAWAEKQSIAVPTSCKLYLQPEWSTLKDNKDLIVNYIKNNPKWQLSLQTHKFIGVD